jgi:hypothetical protein
MIPSNVSIFVIGLASNPDLFFKSEGACLQKFLCFFGVMMAYQQNRL